MAARSRVDQVEVALLLVLVGVVLFGNALLVCAPEGRWQPGMRDWAEGSWFKPLVGLLSLNYTQPTLRGVEIKDLIFRLGACAAMLVAAVAWLARLAAPIFRRESAVEQPSPALVRASQKVSLPTISQLLLVGYVVWAGLAVGWSSAPRQAAGYAGTMLFWAMWSVVLGRRLGPRGARIAGGLMVAAMAAAAALGLAHHYIRSPGLRLSYPIGNPLPFAAMLLTPLCLAVAAAVFVRPGKASGQDQASFGTSVQAGQTIWARLLPVGAIIASAVMVWALALTQARGAMLGLLAALLLPLGLWLRRRGIKALLLGAVVAVCSFGIMTYVASGAFGRAASVRLRPYAWGYALRMFAEHPIAGDGGGTYSRLAPQMGAIDRWRDPGVLTGQIVSHAHCEWLEALADLGVIGAGLWAGCWVVTVIGLVRRRRLIGSANRSASMPGGWFVISLVVATLAIVVSQATEVAMRMPGLPAIAATMLGLAWAVCTQEDRSGLEVAAGAPLTWRPFVAVALLLPAGVGGLLAWGDWRASRAAYEGMVVAGQGDLGQAERFLERAAGGQLDPARNLESLHRRLETAVALAEGGAVETGSEGPGPTTIEVSKVTQSIERGVTVGRYLERVAPGYGRVRELMASLGEVKVRLLEAQGEEDLAARTALEVRRWLVLARRANRADPTPAVRLLGYMTTEELNEGVALLRDALRDGPIAPNVGRALEAINEQAGFDEAVATLLQQAEQLAEHGDKVAVVTEAVPETFRLAAAAAQLRGEPAEAAQLAGRAADSYARLDGRFDVAHSSALQEQAWYMFVSDPDAASEAVGVVRQALDVLPDRSARSGPARRVRRDMALYLLADGEQAAAAEQLRLLQEAAPNRDQPSAQAATEAVWARLLWMFLGTPPEDRPSRFTSWVDRAAAEWGESVDVGLALAQVALERGDEPQAEAALLRVRQLEGGPEALERFVTRLLRSFPDSPILRRLAGQSDSGAAR
ncbi:MAG TPA: O-antigen ligase family protein [Phycisphaerae bacterium]|nr:O-antigen ligase family protein [Phycisphaerae bacterium]